MLRLTSMKPSLVLVFLGGTLACACNQGQKAPLAAKSTGSITASAEGQSGSDVVAKVGSEQITMSELNEHVATQLREMQEQAFEVKKQGLEQMVNQRLVKAAAFKKGLSEEQFMKEAVEAKVTPPSDKAVKGFFEQNSAQLPPGAKFEEYKERIVMFMTRQAQNDAAKELFDALRADNKVQITLSEPPKPRIDVEAEGPSTGPKDAKVTIVEFSDFECPFCARGRENVAKVMAKYDGKVRLVFRQFPLSFHAHAKKAGEAALCANAQDKFWAYHDALFAEQKKLSVEDLKATAKTLGLDEAAFAKCLDTGAMEKTLAADMAAGTKAGVTGTPAFFINGVMLSGAQGPEAFEHIIDQELSGT